MKPESIKFLHQIKERAGHIPDVMSLVNSIFYEEGHFPEIQKCPTCGADWLQMEKDLGLPNLITVHYEAEALLAKCSECAKHFGR